MREGGREGERREGGGEEGGREGEPQTFLKEAIRQETFLLS